MAVPLPRLALALVLAACEPSPTPAARATPPEAPRAPEPLPARFDAHVHAPGADADVHVNASMENWTVTGCISNLAGVCDKTRTFDASMDARKDFIRIWQDVRATPRCEPEGQWPGDRAYELSWNGGAKSTGRLPASEADVDKRNEGPCRAHARLAMWFVRQFRDAR